MEEKDKVADGEKLQYEKALRFLYQYATQQRKPQELHLLLKVHQMGKPTIEELYATILQETGRNRFDSMDHVNELVEKGILVIDQQPGENGLFYTNAALTPEYRQLVDLIVNNEKPTEKDIEELKLECRPWQDASVADINKREIDG